MKKKNLFILFIPLFLFIVLTVLLFTVDRKIIGTSEVKVGLATINECLTGEFDIKAFDIISDICMGVSFALILAMVVLGIYQLVKRKSLWKVDKIILLFGACLVVLFGLWILFDKAIVVNCRPKAIDGVYESSFPSTHVMLVTFVVLSCSWIMTKKMDKKKYLMLAYVFSLILIIITSISRILSGMHWFTDVIGGLLLGFGLSFTMILIDCWLLSEEDCKEKI